MFFSEKYSKRINELKSQIIKKIWQIDKFSVAKVDYESYFDYRNAKFDQEFKIGTIVIGRDDYYILKFEFDLTDEQVNSNIYGYFDLGKTGRWFEGGFESLLYVNDEAISGCDQNHKKIQLRNLKIGKNVGHICFWTGLEDGGPKKDQIHEIKDGYIGIFDENVNMIVIYLENLMDSYKVLTEENFYAIEYKKIITNVFKKISSREDYSVIVKYIEGALSKFGKTTDITMNCVGHTHIDLAWLWRLKHTKHKGIRTFNTVISLMDRFEDFKFIQSQPQLYQWIKEEDPELYGKIKEKIKLGNWEAGGTMWVEPDMNLAGGEALVRQILYGVKFYEEEFGYINKNKHLWLPDVFGYSWCLPQLLKSIGVETFFTTKMTWNDYNPLQEHTFNWKGIDGTEILAHIITTPHPLGERHTVYNSLINELCINGTWKRYNSKEVNNQLLVAYGYGDGGGGVNENMIRAIDAVNKIPTFPNVKHSTVSEYIDKLNDSLKQSVKDVHTWNDELYLEFHRGTYTTQGLIKKYNRLLENKYNSAEVLSTMVHLFDNVDYQKEQLEKGWKILLTNQFHDILPGSGIREVVEDAIADYKVSESIVDDVITEITDKVLIDCENVISVFNPNPQIKNNVVLLPNFARDGYLVSGDNKFSIQKSENDSYVFIDGLKSTTFNEYQFIEFNSSNKQVSVYSNEIDGNFYKVKWNENGHITSIFDKYLNRELLNDGELGNVFEVFVDDPRTFEAWEIEKDILDDIENRKELINELTNVSIISEGEVFTKLRFGWKYKTSTLEQIITIHNKIKRIDFETDIDWNIPEKLVKVSFPTAVITREATFDVQFGNIKRPTHHTSSWQTAKFESCAHNYVDVSQYDFGVSLLNNGKYGHDIFEGKMRLTVLKSAIHPDVEADIGKQSFMYSITSHDGDIFRNNIVEEGYRVNNPFVANIFKKSNHNKELLRISESNVSIDSIKLSESGDSIIVRLHEYTGGNQTISLESDYNFKNARLCSILEDEIEEIDLSNISFKPYEIKSIKLTKGV